MNQSPTSVPTITVDTLKERLDGDHPPLLVDVREDDEWTASHITGATHVPLASLPTRLGDLDAGRPVVFICHLGARSERAALFALRSGRGDVASVEGGMDSWSGRGYPTATGA